MARFTLQALGRDRPGIVAEVTGALARMAWNIEDSSMTILQGQFSMVMVLDAHAVADGRAVEAALGSVVEELDLFIAVRPVPEDVKPFVSDSALTVSVHGSDRADIVARIASDVAAAGADIFELVSRLIDGEYVLRLTAALALGSRSADLEETLRRAAAELGVACDISSSPSVVQ